MDKRKKAIAIIALITFTYIFLFKNGFIYVAGSIITFLFFFLFNPFFLLLLLVAIIILMGYLFFFNK